MEAMERKENAKRSVGQFIKFALVGVLNTLVDTVVFRLLNWLFSWYLPAQIIGYCCGIVNSYLLNTAWTFKKERKRDLREMLSFLALNLVILGISLGLLLLFRDGLGIAAWWDANTWCPAFLMKLINGEFFCKLIATLICILLNFIGNKLFVFRAKPAPQQAAKEG